MLNTIKILVIFSALSLLVLLPKSLYASQDWHDRARHDHGFHSHVNPDLTLVTGMDTIDSKVLVDADPDPTPEVVDQPVPDGAATPPSQMISSGDDGNYIINVPNNAGGYTPIRIQRSGNGYVGPQGELYYPFPEITQLKAMYGI